MDIRTIKSFINFVRNRRDELKDVQKIFNREEDESRWEEYESRLVEISHLEFELKRHLEFLEICEPV